jgi:molybdopterin synthase catalytic subunit
LYEISDTPLDLAAITRSVLDTGAGGLVTFVGYVRETSDDGRPVDGLIYEAHAALALAVLREIGAEAIARFGPARVAIAHRVG